MHDAAEEGEEDTDMKKKEALIISIVAALAVALIVTLCIVLPPYFEKAPKVGEFTLAANPSPEISEKLDHVTKTFIQCYEENNAEGVLPLLSDEFGATKEDVQSFFDRVHKIAEAPFVPYDSYYMKGLSFSYTLIKVKKSETDKKYIELVQASGELYCALYVSEGEKISFLMTLLLIPSGDDFKIAFINPGDFKYSGKDAPALFEETKAQYNDGSLIASYITSCMLGNTLRPGGYFRYENDVEMEDMCYKLYTEIAEKFELPITLSDTSNSAVYEISIANDATHGVIPHFLVKTDVPSSDKAACEAEGQKVIDALEKLSPGIRESFDYAQMNVTNDNLTEETQKVNSESVIIKLK